MNKKTQEQKGKGVLPWDNYDELDGYDDYDEQCERMDEDGYEEEEDYSDFNCKCGAWRWDKKEGRPIHVADCCCGSSEPW